MDRAPNLQNEKLIQYLEKLRGSASDSQPADRLKKFEKYYTAKFNEQDNDLNLKNGMNICKPIVETKVTLVLDSMITTSVKPSPMSLLQNDSDLDTFYKISEILENAKDHVYKINEFESFKQTAIRGAYKLGVAIAETTWDNQLSNGLGDVKMSLISPLDFFPDPSAKRIEDANFIFVRCYYSKFTLKKLYPDFIKDIDTLSESDESSASKNKPSGKPTGIINTLFGSNSSQQYTYDNASGIKGVNKNITVWKCYLKDDSPFIPEKTDDQEQIETKMQQFQYPYGRCIIYAGKDLIFDDKPIAYPYGFPFDILYDIETDDIWGQGEIEDLIEIQDKINKSLARQSSLMQEFLSAILFEAVGGDLDRKTFPGAFTIMVPRGTFSSNSEPRVLTNNTLSELKTVTDYIEYLKASALEIARINKMMMTGERSSGVNSGQMVQDLNESPMAGIRGVQRNFKEFLIGITNKVIVLTQLYYNVPRFIRIGEGKKFAKIPGRIQGEELPTQIFENGELIDEIKGDLSIGEYEIEVTAGSEMPRSKAQIAQLTMQMAEAGYLGDLNDVFVKEKVLQSIQFPNYREIINHMIEKQEELQKQPPNVASLLEKLTGSLKDLPPDKLEYLLNQIGFPQSQIPITPHQVTPTPRLGGE